MRLIHYSMALLTLLFVTTPAFTITENKANKTYKEKFGSHSAIVGDESSASEFKSHLKLSFWEGEESFWIEWPGKKGTPVVVDGNEIDLDFAFDKHKWYKNGKDFKWIVTLKKKPATNKYVMNLGGDWQSFEFHYQVPFSSPEEFTIDGEDWLRGSDGSERNRIVDGSYAVYHATKRNNQYKTGKACHIYVPKATDKNGLVAYTTLHIDNGIYTVTIPQAYLDTCVYPVRINDTFGYTTVGGTDNGSGFGSGWMFGDEATPSSSGTVQFLSIWERDGNIELTGGIYDNAATGTLISNGSTAENSVGSHSGVPQWTDLTYGTDPSVVGSTEYRLAVHIGSGTQPHFFYDVVAGAGAFDNDETYSGGTMPASLPWDNTSYSKRFSLYADYTPSGGGATAAQIIMLSDN